MKTKFGIFLLCFVFQTFILKIVEGSSKTDIGLKFSPRINNESTLIRLKSSKQKFYEEWSKILEDYLNKYYNTYSVQKGSSALMFCNREFTPVGNKVCDVDIRQFGQCGKETYFGYHRIQPCIFLELEKIQGWIPEYYDNIDDLPADMPEDLKSYIKYNVTQLDRNNIWVSCAGETPTDVEYLGPIGYYPSFRGFPGYYFPYLSVDGYLSPLVAVQFKRPASGIVLNVECRVWAKNINYSFDKSGSVHFELFIE